MAKIILSVESKIDESSIKGLDTLKERVSTLSNELNKIKVNKDLTEQLKQLTNALKESTNASTKLAESEERRRTQAEKTRLEQEKINTELLRQRQIEERIAREREKENERLARAAEKRAEAATRAYDKEQQAAERAQSKSAEAVETLRKSVSNLIGSLKTLEQQYAEGTFGNVSNNTSQYREQLQTVLDALDQYAQKTRNNIELDDDEIAEIERLRTQYRQLAADIAKAKNVTGAKLQTADPFNGKTAETISSMQSRYSNLLRTIQNMQRYYAKGVFAQPTAEAQAHLQSLNQLAQAYQTNGQLTAEQQEQLNKIILSYKGVKAATDQAAASNKNYHGTLKDIVSGFLKFQLSAMLVMKPLQMIRNAWQSINETLTDTENKIIALRRVAGDAANANDLYDLAIKFGQTVENVNEAMLTFARRGMSWNESLKATEAALLAVNTADMTVAEATDGLSSVMSQFGIEASKLTEIVDKVNKANDKFPVTSEKILAALQRVGSTASAVKLPLDQTIGLITTLSKATNRSGQNIGTALNAILNIAQKSSTLDTFSKLSKDVASVVEQFRGGGTSILEVLRAVSAEVQNLDSSQVLSTEEFNKLNDALKESMGEDFEILSDIYGTAGTYRRNYFVALLNDLDTVKAVQEEIADANGYSAKQNEDYLTSYTAKSQALQAQWQKLANDEQGFLAFKKGLVDIASGLLTAAKWTNGLSTAVIALGGALTNVLLKKYGASIANWAVQQTNLARVIRGQAIPSLESYSAKIKSLKAEILTTIDSEKLLALQEELLAAKTQRLTLVMNNLATAVTAATIVFSALSAIQGAIDESRAESEKKEQERLRTQNEAIEKSLSQIDTYKDLNEKAISYRETIENLRKTLDDATASETDREQAQNSLLNIQNTLIESNNAYANSLDLINGKIAEQLGLIEQLTEEQLKQNAQKFLDENYAQINNAESSLTNTDSLTLKLLYDVGAASNSSHSDIIRKVIEKAAEEGIDLSSYEYTEAPTAYSPILYYEELIRKAANGQDTSVWDWLGFTGIKDMFTTGEAWGGASTSGVTLGGTVDERIEKLKQLKQLIVDNYAEFGISHDESVAWVEKIDSELASLDTEEYKNAQILADKAQATRDYIDRLITRAEYLEKVYGIVDKTFKDITDLNQISGNQADNLIQALKDLYNLEKKATDEAERREKIREKELAVAEAEKALEDAKNARGVKRVGESGRLEIQQDEKKIAEAEDALLKAQEDLAEEQKSFNDWLKETAWNELITTITNGTSNSDVIKLLGSYIAKMEGDKDPEWANKYLGWIKDITGIDIPAFDNGGIAYGLGAMPKATARPEAVLNPDLTAKILSPTNNEQFERALANIGAMYETGRYYAQAAPIYNSVGGTTNNTYNNGATINGVTIGGDMMNKPFIEVLAAIGLVPNNK